jgi:uncharacterized protein involved in outer membrane biogenesis
MKKKFVKVIIGLVVGLLAAVIIAFVMIDSLAKAAIEQGGTYALGVDVAVDEADVQPFAGRFVMSSLAVSNPSGFSAPHFMALGSGDVNVSLGSLRSDLIELDVLALDGVNLQLQRKDGKTNYGAVLENLKRFESEEAKPAEESTTADGGKKFIVRQLKITNTNVGVDLLGLDKADSSIQVKLPPIEMKDVGSKQNGLAMGELASLIIKVLLSTTVSVGDGVIPSELLGDLQGKLATLASVEQFAEVLSNVGAELGNTAATMGEGVKNVAETATKDLGKAAEDGKKLLEEGSKQIDGLKGLIPSKDKDGGD